MGFGDVKIAQKSTSSSGFGAVASKRKKTGGTDYEAILSAATEQGYAPKEKVGTVTRIINALSALETGGEAKTILETGDVGKAAQQYVGEAARGVGSLIPLLDRWTKPNELATERTGYSQAFEEAGWEPTSRLGKITKGVVGFTGDVLLDPTTYIGGSVVKNLVKGGVKGTSVLGRYAAKGLSKSGAGTKILENLGKVSEGAKVAFVPAYKAKQVAPELVDMLARLGKKTQLGDRKAAESVAKLIKEYGEDAFNQAYKYDVEAGVSSPAADAIRNLIQEKTAQEVPLGLRKTTLPNYVSRIVKKEPQTMIPTKRGLKPSIGGATKQRVYGTWAEGEAAGVKYLEPREALTRRLMSSQRAQEVKGALNQMVVGEIKDIDGNPLLKPLKGKLSPLMPDHVPVTVGKNGIQIGDKSIGFYPGEIAGKKFVGVTTKKAKFQLHKDTADYLTQVQKVVGDDDSINAVLKMYDHLLGLWKGSVTSLFPAFHVRNALSNIFNNMVGGVYNPEAYIKAGQIQKGTGALTPDLQKLFPDIKTFEKLKDFLEIENVTRGGQFAKDVPDTLAELLGKRSLGRKILSTPRSIGIAIEDNARIAHFIDKVRKGNSVADAAKSVNKFLFDYGDLTPFEQNVMKRIFPFYVFTRKNVPLQIEQVLKQPVKYRTVLRAIEQMSTGELTPEEKEFMPDYIRESFGITVGRGPTGEPQMLAGLGLPIEDINKIGKPYETITDMLAPTVKYPIEKSSGYSLFHQDKISNTSAYNSTTKAIASIPGLRQWLKAKETTDASGRTYYRVDPGRMHSLKSWVGRFISTGEKLTDERKTVLARALNSLTGVKIYTPDIEKSKEDTILEMLEELGLAREFTTSYVPKDVKKELGV